MEEEEEKDGSEEWVEHDEKEILLGEEDELCLQPFWSQRMLSKRQRPYDESELPAANRLRANIRDIFASNTLPASRVQSLLNDASDAGVDDCREHRGIPKNAHRNLRRSFLKKMFVARSVSCYSTSV